MKPLQFPLNQYYIHIKAGAPSLGHSGLRRLRLAFEDDFVTLQRLVDLLAVLAVGFGV